MRYLILTASLIVLAACGQTTTTEYRTAEPARDTEPTCQDSVSSVYNHYYQNSPGTSSEAAARLTESFFANCRDDQSTF